MVQPNPNYRTQVTEATYDGGVLRPVTPLSLREHERVHLIVQSVVEAAAPNAAERQRAMVRLREGIRSMKFRSSGAYPTRDELHDRA